HEAKSQEETGFPVRIRPSTWELRSAPNRFLYFLPSSRNHTVEPLQSEEWGRLCHRDRASSKVLPSVLQGERLARAAVAVQRTAYRRCDKPTNTLRPPVAT